MSDDRTTAYAEALFAVARSEGPLSEVEDELFRVAQVVKGNDELRDKLADPHIPVATRQQIIVEVLHGVISSRNWTQPDWETEFATAP